MARLAGHVRVVDVRPRVIELPPLPPAEKRPLPRPPPTQILSSFQLRPFGGEAIIVTA